VAAWIAEWTGRAHVAPQRGWDELVRTGHRRRVPRPRHAQSADPAAAAAFLNEAVEQERAPDRPVEVWAFDEHRAGLKPVLRRVWTKRGQRPLAIRHPRDKGLYLYGFVRPLVGIVEWFIGSTVDPDLVSERTSPGWSAPVRRSSFSSCSTKPVGMSVPSSGSPTSRLPASRRFAEAPGGSASAGSARAA
jgi:hypothetical protein